MSYAIDIIATVSGFFADRGYPESEVVLLAKEIIEDLDGDPETWHVEEYVAKEYAWHKEHAAQPRLHLTASGVGTAAVNPLQASMFAEVSPATFGGR